MTAVLLLGGLPVAVTPRAGRVALLRTDGSVLAWASRERAARLVAWAQATGRVVTT